MPDLYHIFGNDLNVSGGDLVLASGSDEITQRLYRRLGTNAGGYLWDGAYGAGLPGRVGDPYDHATLQSIVLDQMLREDGVVQNPPPTVTVSSSGADGITTMIITYTPNAGADPVTLSIPLTG